MCVCVCVYSFTKCVAHVAAVPLSLQDDYDAPGGSTETRHGTVTGSRDNPSAALGDPPPPISIPHPRRPAQRSPSPWRSSSRAVEVEIRRQSGQHDDCP